MQSMVLSGAWVVGPIMGGWLADAYGARNAFYAAGVGIGLCSLGYSTLPETLPKVLKGRPVLKPGAGGAKASTAASGGDGAAGGASGGGGGGSEVDGGTRGATPPEGSSALATMLPLLRSNNVQALSALSTASALGQARAASGTGSQATGAVLGRHGEW